MRPINRALFFLLVTSTLLPLFSSAKEEAITVGVRADFPPYSYTNKHHEQTGFTIELIKNLCPKKRPLTFTAIKNFDQQNEEDILGIICSAQLPEGYTFLTIPHQIEYAVFMRFNSGISSLASLYDKKITLVKYDAPFKDLSTKRAAHIVNETSYSKAILMLNSGINDCAIVPKQTGLSIINRNNISGLEYISTPYLTLPSGIAIKSTEKELIEDIQHKLNAIILNNDYQNIVDSWLNQEDDFIRHKNAHPGLFLLGIVFIILILALLLIIRMLHKELALSIEEQIINNKPQGLAPFLFPLNDRIIKSILEGSPNWMLISDAKGDILHASRSFMNDALNMRNLPLKCTYKDFFDDPLSLQLLRSDEEIYSRRSRLSSLQAHFSIGGIAHNKNIVRYPIQLVDNAAIYILSIFFNPTLENAQVFANFTGNAMLQKIIDAIPDRIILKSNMSQIVSGNTALYTWLEKPKRDVVGKTLKELLGKQTGSVYDESDQLVLKSGISWEGTITEPVINGFRKIHCSKTPVKLHGEITGIIAIHKDITQMEAGKEEVENARQIALESNRIKSSFLANLSHEIRTPMNTIIGFTDLLSDPDLTYDQRIDLIDIIQQNGHSLVDLIDDIIDISKIEAGQIYLKYNDFNLNNIILEAYVAGENKKLQLHKEEIDLSYTIGSIKDEFYIHSDGFRIRQILKNLFNTSIHSFSDGSLYMGYLVLDDKLFFYLNNDKYKVSDSFARELIANEQAEYTFSDVEESSGVSLIIAKNLIEMMEGSLWCLNLDQSQPEFYFTLPYVEAQSQPVFRASEELSASPNWAQYTFLIAEDEETNFIVLSGTLAKTGVHIIHARDGQETIDMYQENQDKIDLVLMDIRMPVKNGVEASKEILNLNPDAIILAQTAYVMQEDKETYENAGMKGVLSKPIDTMTMFTLINKVLS